MTGYFKIYNNYDSWIASTCLYTVAEELADRFNGYVVNQEGFIVYDAIYDYFPWYY